MREGYEEESEDMVEQQLECQGFSLKKKQNISNWRTKKVTTENSFDIFHVDKCTTARKHPSVFIDGFI